MMNNAAADRASKKQLIKREIFKLMLHYSRFVSSDIFAEAVNEALAEGIDPTEPDADLISVLNLSSRVYNAIYRSEVAKTVPELALLVRQNPTFMLEIRNFGDAAMKEVINALRAYGIEDLPSA